MDETQEALIDGVELAIDWGLPILEEDMKEYIRLTAYQQGRVDARREAVKSDMHRRRQQLDKLKLRTSGMAFLLLLILAALVTKEASTLIVFTPVALAIIWKGE